MVNRKILYGYKIEHGSIMSQPEEKPIVQRVFTGYLAGLSYQRLADSLNGDGVWFSQEAPEWNKHKIKRLLEDPRYTGKDDYPALIDPDTFQQVQGKIAGKTAGQVSRKNKTDALWPRLRCGRCQGRLVRTGGALSPNGSVRLKCTACGGRASIQPEELLAQTARQLAEHGQPDCKPYAPSAEVIRLDNAIDRALERPEDGQAAIALILRGACARYNCCGGNLPLRQSPTGVIDWSRFKQTVSQIIIGQDGTVTVEFHSDGR